MTILSHDAQVIIPTLIAVANQLGIQHFAIKLLFCRFIDVFERSNHARFPQSKHRVGILYLGCRRGPAAGRGGRITATGSAAFPVTASVPVPTGVPVTAAVPVSAAIPAAVTPAIPAAVTPAVPAAVAPAIPATVATAIPAAVAPAIAAAVAPAIAATGKGLGTESSENGFAGE